MSSRSYFLVSFLFVAFLSGSALDAGEILWDGEAGDYMYCTPNNWDGNAVPDVNILAWETGAITWGDLNDAFIDDPTLASPVIIDDTCSPPPCAKLVVGGDSDVPGIGLEIRGGEFQTFELLVGYRPTGSGTIRMTGGVINMLDYSYLGVGDGGNGTFIMEGGEINCHLSETCAGAWIDWAGGLMVPKAEQGKATGHLQLNGGIIRCRWFEIKDGGTVDIAGGTLAITVPDYWYWDLDQRESVAEYMTDGVLYAYGGDPRAEVMGVDDEETGYYVISGYQYSLGQAYNPSPGYCARDVSPEVTTLSWSPGDYADSHDLYFGTDKAAVESATTPMYQLDVDMNSHEIPLEEPVLGKIYYWRVDEVNESEESIVKGLTWNFRIKRYIVVDDFDSYGLSINPIYDTWSDIFTNGTRAEINLETADANFIIDGNSMEFGYGNNMGPYYSESTRIFSPSMDWVTGSIKALVLWFHGRPDNDAERMYLRVTDGGSPRGETTIVYEDSNDLIQEAEDAWQEWNIDMSDANFSGVDLNDINGITIGFGDRDNPQLGGSGYVYFEDIRLYPRRCRWDISRGYGDVTGDCDVDHYDVEAMGQDWLAYDYNTVDYPAVLVNYDDPDSAWRPSEGKIGGALHFAGGGNPDLSWEALENVEIPPLNLWEPDANGVTISAWIKPQGEQYDFSGIVFSRDGVEGAYGPGDTCGGLSITNSNKIKYHWHDEHWESNPNFTAPDETWSFVALVVMPTESKIWFDDGTGLENPAVNAGTHEVEAFAGITRIGEDEKDEPRHFKGLIDDVRIYRYALNQSQIEQLAAAGASGEPSPAPMVRYEFEETSGTIVPDTGTSETVYHPLESPANLYDEEPQYHQYVNFRDYCIMADNWLAAEMLWP